MGFFEIFKKKGIKKNKNDEVSDKPLPTHGWDAITTAFEKLYPGQKNPFHRAPLVYRMHDLSDNAAAYDGISAYDAGEFWHFVTYGLSELYDKMSEESQISGFGYEFTFRLPHVTDTPPAWAFDFLEVIGKQVWKGDRFAVGHTIRTGPLDGRSNTLETAVLVIRDPSLPQPVETPNGRVEFLLLLGVEENYRQLVLNAYETSDKISNWEEPIVNEIRKKNSNLVTPIYTSGQWGE